MHRFLTLIQWLLLGLAGLLVLLVIGSALNHRLRSPHEAAAYPAPGQLVAVNGHRLHVYAEGTGDLTLVFLAGSATPAPVLDFKALYGRLSDEYRTVVVERAGYGWSDDSRTPRDIETVLDETRRALTAAGERPPYVLLPHSMAALEALHWAHRHPGEVVAIVGLDPALPPVYVHMPPPRLQLALISFTAWSGLLRLAPAVCHASPAVPHLSEAETSAYCSIMVRRTLTADMRAEVAATQANAQRVAAAGFPTVPLHAFISRGDGQAIDNWRALLLAYVEAAGGQATLLDVGHYVHNEAPDPIATAIRVYLQQHSEALLAP